jgi:hypothetical protein
MNLGTLRIIEIHTVGIKRSCSARHWGSYELQIPETSLQSPESTSEV